MAKKDKTTFAFEVNPAGVIKLLQSNAVMKMLEKESEKLGRFESSYVGFDRAHVVVKED